MPSDALNLGNVGVTPAAFREFFGRFIAVTLDHVPEERQAEAMALFAEVLDEIVVKPAQPGETILVGDAAAEALHAALAAAFEETRRTRGAG